MLIATMNDPNAQVKLKSCYALESFAENCPKKKKDCDDMISQ